ncbi:MAG: hypothetical protein OXQ29_16480 [Rhodospirillaceae bacterium]|nr:hypothetical protein [Rhodospirillaceae bacterium]
MSDTMPASNNVQDPAAAPTQAGTETSADSGAVTPELVEAVGYVLGDCFFAVGQTIGMRMTVDYDAVVWWHDHFKTRFLAAMRRQGNRWLQDRDNVTGVGWMLAERAVRHSAGRNSINVEAARRAAADVERYCELRSKRAAPMGEREADTAPRLAGYWCVGTPY